MADGIPYGVPDAMTYLRERLRFGFEDLVLAAGGEFRTRDQAREVLALYSLSDRLCAYTTLSSDAPRFFAAKRALNDPALPAR